MLVKGATFRYHVIYGHREDQAVDPYILLTATWKAKAPEALAQGTLTLRLITFDYRHSGIEFSLFEHGNYILEMVYETLM